MKVYPYECSMGTFYLEASEGKLERIYLKKESLPPDAQIWERDAGMGPKPKIIRRAMSQLDEYFLGMRKEFNLALDMKGTEFEKRVWEETRKIPYGETISYGELSLRLTGDTKASRAVGRAMGKNPIPIVVPCHRVVGSDGSLTGFEGGLDMKANMLALEWLNKEK